MRFSYKRCAVAVIVFTLIISTLLFLIADRSTPAKNERYVLKEHNNTAALFKGDELIATFEGVVVSSLPSGDRKRLRDGIPLENPEDAQAIIEDYDG